jgi:hypothetical protein
MAAPDYLRYLNQNATRNKPLSPELANALGFLPELGVTAEVFSGGQDGKGEGDRRTGSVRHDHGDAADVFFTQNGRRLDWANPEDRPVFEEIVRRGKANGLTGFGAGPGYMQAGSMHVGFGSPGVWGAGGRGANAPDWLRMAYGEAKAGAVPAGSGGQETAFGGAGNDDLTGGSMPQNPMPENVGGLGGLGGFVRSPAFGDWLTAVGTSMMSSGSDAPLANFGNAFANQQQLRQRQNALDQERADKEGDRRALEMALMSRGMTADQARAYSSNAQAAGVAVDGIERQQKLALAQQERDRTAGFLSGITGAAAGATEPVMAPVEPAGGDVASSTNTGSLAQATRAADDAIAVTGSDAKPEPMSSFNTGNRTVDALMGKRAQIARMLTAAPSDDAFTRGKLALDQIDKQIEQYAPTAAVKEYTFAMSQRLEAGEPMVKFEDWDREQKKAGATVVNTGSDSGAFYKTADEKRAGAFVTAADQGINAQRQMIQIDQLEGLLGNFETGGAARLKQVAGDYGINTDGLSDIQAAEALISQLVPSQRAPGSGTMSDADLALFKQSLPRIIAQPGGNAKIIQTMRGIANYDMQVGDIADRVLNREITPAEGRKLMAEIENPLAAFKRQAGSAAAGAPKTDAAGYRGKYGLE